MEQLKAQQEARELRQAMEVQIMKNWKPVNRNQLESLFAENACLFGNVDRIPIETAKAMFGVDAIDFATSMNNTSGRNTRNGYGIGAFTAEYITLHGAMVAATYCNIVCLADVV